MNHKFSHVVITGTSGVGKTYLEEKLAETGLFSPLPKIVDRPRRAGDNPQMIIPISTQEFLARKKAGEFFFTLEYIGNHYGWLKADLKAGGRHTLAITLKSLKPFLEQNSSFLPILLDILPKNFSLLEKRMRSRGEPEEKIKQRLALANAEYREMAQYRQTIKDYQGLVFEVESDSTIPEIVVPQALNYFSATS